MARNDDPVRERVVAAALRAIDEGGTASLRVVAVAHDAGVSQGMIRYYFGDRQGLVDEALARRFGDRFGELLVDFADAVKGCATPGEFRLVISRVLDGLFVPERTKLRLERNSDVGEAVARPELAAKIGIKRDEALSELRDIIVDAQSRGLMKADLDASSVAAFHLAMVHGYSLFEVGGRSLDLDAFNAVYKQALFALIFD
ncbi:MAG: TetR family transcriptional regulator [Ilumatobacteraceae bacterium]|nr:TetR family transcriptional regulator [Ilumatobacteraceae bacterium]